MRKRLIIFIFFGFVSSVNAELLSDKNDIKINSIDLDVLLETAPVHAQKSLLKDKAKLNYQLEQLYLRKAIANEARNAGLDKDAMNAARLEYVLNNALYLLQLDALKKQNTKDYSKYARLQYDKDKSKYKAPLRIDAAHILISNKDMTDAEALEKAQQIREKLNQDGVVFAELAIQESDDKSVQTNNGELGLFVSGQMVKPFEEAALAMQPGEISEPVKTRYGYHIIKLNKIIPAGPKSFDEVKDVIIEGIKKKDWEVERADYYKQLEKANKMQVDDAAVDEYITKKLQQLDAAQ